VLPAVTTPVVALKCTEGAPANSSVPSELMPAASASVVTPPAVVIEAVAEPLAAEITREIAIPTIGIGASATCDGQVLVLEDMLGLSPWVPKFVKRYTTLGPSIEAAVSAYADEVRSRAFPGPANVYPLKVER